MAFAGVPILTINYETIDWFGAEKYMNFILSKQEAFETIKDIINNTEKYKEKSIKLKKFIVNKDKEFFQKLDNLIGV
jgi:hypothetical protein